MQSPLIAAAVGIGKFAMRLNSVCPSTRYCMTCSRFILRISNRSAPALNDRALAEAKMTPAGRSRSIESRTRFKSASNCGAQVLSGLPGTSSQTVMIFCSSVMADAVLGMTLSPFQKHGGALPAADAQGRYSQIDVAALHLK